VYIEQVAAQTARRCEAAVKYYAYSIRLYIQYVYYFRAYQRQRTPHGVGVVTIS